VLSPIAVYYDGWCPVCTAVRHRVSRLDWLGLLRWQSIREPGSAALRGVPAERLEQRMHVRDLSTGRVYDGIWAVAALAARVPALMPLWPGVAAAAALGFGQPLYDWVASRRTIVPVGHCDDAGCQIHGGAGSGDEPRGQDR
jgi:predicted DCC family thiol-disulfide oxidoreductase YuxK